MQNPEYQAALSERKFLERLVRQKAIIDHLLTLHKEEKAAVAAAMNSGWKADIENQFGGKLGTISLSNPEAKIAVDDPAVAVCGFAEHDLEYTFRDLEADWWEIITVLENHAPMLLTVRPTEEALKEAAEKHTKNYRRTGEVPAGWKATKSAPRLTLRSTPMCKEDAAELLADLAIPQLPSIKRLKIQQGESGQ